MRTSPGPSRGARIAVRRTRRTQGEPGVRPSAHQFTDYAAPWEPIPDDGLPRFPERLPPGARRREP